MTRPEFEPVFLEPERSNPYAGMASLLIHLVALALLGWLTTLPIKLEFPPVAVDRLTDPLVFHLPAKPSRESPGGGSTASAQGATPGRRLTRPARLSPCQIDGPDE